METWYQTVFAETGRLPTQAESYAQGRLLGLARPQVNQFLLSQSERSFGIAGRNVRQTLWRSFSTAQADLGFLRLNKKDYGMFLLGRRPPPRLLAASPPSPGRALGVKLA